MHATPPPPAPTPPPLRRIVLQLHRMDSTVGRAIALYGSATEHSVEHITAVYGSPIMRDVAAKVSTQAAQGVGMSTGVVCSGAVAIAVAGVAYSALRDHIKAVRERAEHKRRAHEKAQACQELLELAEKELAGLYASYCGQRRALVGLRELLKAKEHEVCPKNRDVKIITWQFYLHAVSYGAVSFGAAIATLSCTNE